MATFFNFLAHILIIVGCLAMISFTGAIIFAPLNSAKYELNDANVEATLRVASAMLGFLIYISATAIDISMPDLILKALSQTNILSGINKMISFAIFVMLIPIGSGIVVSRYIIKGSASSVLIITIVFIIVTFSDVYIATYNKDLLVNGYNKALLPNILFILSVGFYVVFHVLFHVEPQKHYYLTFFLFYQLVFVFCFMLCVILNLISLKN
jgi:hypothetical protein